MCHKNTSQVLISSCPSLSQRHYSCHVLEQVRKPRFYFAVNTSDSRASFVQWSVLHYLKYFLITGIHKTLFSHSPYNQIKHCRSLKKNHFVPKKEIPSQWCRVEIRNISGIHRDCKLNHLWIATLAVRENMAVYQVLVLHVNTSDGKIGKQAKFIVKAVISRNATVSRTTFHPCTFVLWYTGISINTT